MFRFPIALISLFISTGVYNQIIADSTTKQNAQEINGIIDGVYFIPQDAPEDTLYLNDFSSSIYNQDFVLENWDSLRYRNTKERIRKKYGEKRPEKFEDALYINPLEMLRDSERSHLFFSEPNNNDSRRPVLPNSIYSFVDTATIKSSTNTTKIVLDSSFNFPFEKYLTPFYIKKTEVTNKEYRAFIRWIRDSIIRDEIYINIASDE